MSKPIRKKTIESWPHFRDGPFWYTRLPEPALSEEVKRLALANSPFVGVDVVSLQPSPDPDVRNEDRWVAQKWDMPDGEWTCIGVFDGHGGFETAAYTARNLPALIKNRLHSLFSSDMIHLHLHETICDTIRDTIQEFDDSLTKEIKNIFPESPEELERMSDAEVRERIADDADGSKRAKIVRCMRGTTVVLAITDAKKENVYTANLGDSVVVLGTTRHWDFDHDIELVTSAHNASGEAGRIQEEHPGEEAIIDKRVLGTLAVTRAIGDHVFKLPAVYTRKIFGNVEGGMRSLGPVLERIKTPPYVSARADVEHFPLPARLRPDGEAILVLASDGLQALTDPDGGRPPVNEWMKSAVRGASHYEHTAGWNQRDCRALTTLRDALGGKDDMCVSAMLTAEMMGKWCDDTTVIVQRISG